MKKIAFILFIPLCVIAFIISAFKNHSERFSNEATSVTNSVISINPDSDSAIVYMTTDISPSGLMAVYNALGREATGNVAVKIHSGEPGGHYYLSPDLIKDLVQSVSGSIVECNTAYSGPRATTAMHKQVMIDHGFTAIASTDIMDEEGHIPLPVPNGENIEEDFVGSHLLDYDFLIVLSHFKGHTMGGFGGAIKNMSIGIASSAGKCWIHTAGNSMTDPWGGERDPFLESMAEAAYAVADTFNENICYINVMNNLSVDCDCDDSPAAPTMEDIGILASLDPVALDQACVDLVYAAQDGYDLIHRMETRNGIHTLEHGEAIGFGTRTYKLISIDLENTSVNELVSDKIHIYPNPSSSAIHITDSKNYDYIQIIDVNGKTVAKYNCESEIPVYNLKQGTYIIKFYSKGAIVGNTRFIKN